MRLVIFGTGKLYQTFKKKINREDKIIAFLDNDRKKTGKKMDDAYVFLPEDIKLLNYDQIILVSQYARQMQKQLLELGCNREQIIHFAEYNSNVENPIQYYQALGIKNKQQRKMAIISNSLGYHGGAIAVLNCALALKDSYCDIDLIAEEGTQSFINEINKQGISVILCPNISMNKWEKIKWLDQYDYILVNTLPMILCAIEIAKYRPVFVWLHDSENIYDYMDYWKEDILQGLNSNVKIYAVSDIAKKNFICNIGRWPIDLLPCGIPEAKNRCVKKSKLVFAVIGSIYPIKGQDIFIRALKKLSKTYYCQAQFWIIGKVMDEDYYQQLRKLGKGLDNLTFLEEIEKSKMQEIYSQIDILVVPSRNETLSLTAIEAMSYGNPCIVSDAAGITQYISNMQNGIVFRNARVDELAERLYWCIQNKNEVIKMKKEAKKTYERFFTMNVFQNNLLDILQIESDA